VPTLLAALDSADRSDRGNAIEALGKIGGLPEIATRLAEILQNSSDASDGLRAARALEAMGALAEDSVLPLVGHRENRVHSSACQILVKVGTAKSLDKLKALPKEASTSRQIHIDRAIREIEKRLK
jgi:HEAT repeat protein